MQASVSSFTQPAEFKGFTCPKVNLKTTSIYKGFATTDGEGRELWVGESKDIEKNVKCYSLKNGTLTFQLKEGVVFVRGHDGKWLKNESRDVVYTTDAVLNQLGIAVFEKMKQDGGLETIILLNGRKGTTPPLVYARNPTYNWYRSHYDDGSTEEINFTEINASAFDRKTFKQNEDGSRFSISLNETYKDDASVEYAIHRIFGETHKLTMTIEENLYSEDQM